jgi:SMC interacting uncharacterized protein involved in chromosome segregation
MDWELNGEVSSYLADNFKDYYWYNNQVVLLDRKLELVKKIRNLTSEIDSEIDSERLDDETLQKNRDELKELENELEEVLAKLDPTLK